MVASRKLDDLIFSRKTSGNTDGAHDCFCAGINHADHLYMMDPFTDEFCHLHLFCCCTAKAQAVLTGLDHSLADGGMIMPQDHRSPGPDIVRVGIAVHIKYFASHCALNKARRLYNGAVSPHRAVHTSGNPFYGALK